MARFARQIERSGEQKGRGVEGGGIFVCPHFPPPPNFVPTKLARHLIYKIINPKIIDTIFATKDAVNALGNFNSKN
jgi:hypothetical protein